MNLLDQLKAQQRREAASRKKPKKKTTKKKSRRVPIMGKSQSAARIKKLRAKGYAVSKTYVPGVGTVVLRSKKKKKTTTSAKGQRSNGDRLRARLRGYYKRGELGKASKLRARMKKLGLSTKV